MGFICYIVFVFINFVLLLYFMFWRFWKLQELLKVICLMFKSNFSKDIIMLFQFPQFFCGFVFCIVFVFINFVLFLCLSILYCFCIYQFCIVFVFYKFCIVFALFNVLRIFFVIFIFLSGYHFVWDQAILYIIRVSPSHVIFLW